MHTYQNIFHSLKNSLCIRLLFLSILCIPFFVGDVFAQDTPAPSLPNPVSSETLTDFLFGVVQVLVQFMIPIAAVAIIYSGFLFVTARGSEEQITRARKTFMYAVIGTAVLLGAQVIISVINQTITAL